MYLLATRLWTHYLEEDTNLVYYMCQNGSPLESFSTNTSSICLQICYSTLCDVMEYGPLLTGISAGRSISIFAESDSQMLLMTDGSGLRLDTCEYWNCSSTIRLQTIADIITGSRILGTSLTKSTTDNMAFVYVESIPYQHYRVMYRPNYNSSESILVDTWQATSEWTDSPIFLRYDTSGRTIIGYQRFANNSLEFVIKRSGINNTMEQVAQWPLETRIYEISHAPRQTPSDRAYVALASTSVYTLVYDSTASDPIEIGSYLERDIEPNNGSISPAFNDTPSASLPSEDEPSVSPSPEPSNPIEPQSPEWIEVPSDDFSPSNESSPEASQPLPSPIQPQPSGWQSNLILTKLIEPSSLSFGGYYGFQVSIDFWTSYGPVFAISYYTSSGMMGSVYARCGIDGCEDGPSIWRSQEMQVMNPISNTPYYQAPAVATSFHPSSLSEWRVTVLYPNGIFSLTVYDLLAIASGTSSVSTAYTLFAPAPPTKPPTTKLSQYYLMMRTLIAFGKVVLIIGGVVCAIIVTVLIVIRLVAANELGPVVVLPNRDVASTHQTKTLNLYYASLRE